MRLALVLTFLVLLRAAPATANVVHVPTDEPDLGRALLRAASGDTVRVEPGDYSGEFALRGGVRLESTLGSDRTRITGRPGSLVIRVAGTGTGTALAGFRVDGGAIGVDVRGGVVEFEECDIAGDSIAVAVGPEGMVWLRGSLVHGAGEGLRVGAGGRVSLAAVEVQDNEVGAVVLTGGDLRGTRVRFVENGWGLRAEPGAVVVLGGTLQDGGEFRDNREGAILNLGENPVRVPFFYWGVMACDSLQAMVEGAVVQLPYTDQDHVRTVKKCR
jgi:hypothetical protein